MPTRSEIHGELIDAAVTIANQMEAPRGLVYDGDLFFNANNRSPDNIFTLGITEGVLDTLGDADRTRVFTQLRSTATRALAQAMSEHRETLAGLILADAREGRNYFDRFQ